MSARTLLKNIRIIVTENKLASLLIAIAAFLRLYRLNEFVTFLGDQGRDAIIIKRIITLEHLPAIGPPTSIGQVFLGPFFYYFMSPFLLLFNFNPVGLAFGTAVLSVIGIALSYFIVKKEINQKTALLFLFFLTFLYSNIEASRFSWNPNLLPPFAFITLYFFYKFLAGARAHFAALFGVFLSLSIQLHYLAGLMIPLFIGMVLYRNRKKEIPDLGKKIIFAAGTCIFFSFPLVIFDLRHNFLNLKNLVALATKHDVVSRSSFFSQIADAASGFISSLIRLPVPSLYGLLSLMLFLILYKYMHKKSRLSLFIALMFLNTCLYLLLFSFIQSARLPHYFGSIYFSALAVLSYFLSQLPKKFFSAGLIFAVFGVYLFLNVSRMGFLWENPGNQIQRAQKIARTVHPLVTSPNYQVVPLPYGETDAHIRYFLELEGKRPLPEDTLEAADELFVLCFKEPCLVIGNPQWQIAAFAGRRVDKIVRAEGVTIYKVIHE